MMGAARQGFILFVAFVAAVPMEHLVAAATEPPQDEAAPSATPASTNASADPPAGLDAPRELRLGNEHLKGGDVDAALEAYTRAKSLAPDAREIDFAQGLAEYARGDYERARSLFENAATSTNSALVDDAIYSVGTTYHKQALERSDDPKARIAGLEQAMHHYQTLLSQRPDHAAARDANFKAASAWRQLKQQMQEQEQQQQGDGEKNEEENQDNDESDQQQQEQEGQQEKDGEPQSQGDEQESGEAQQEESDEAQDQNASKTGDDKNEEQKQQQAAEQKEDISKEQAERQLREMMQRIRDRKKKQRKQSKPVTIVPVDKDW